MRVRLGALGTLERHLKLNPHDTRAIYFAAQNLYRIGEKDKAIALAEQAMQQGMNEPAVLYNVACFYTGLGETERAIDLLEQAVSLGWGESRVDGERQRPGAVARRAAVPGAVGADPLISPQNVIAASAR